MNRFAIAVIAPLAAAFAAGPATAHAFLEHASPAVGSRSAAAPPQIRLWFSEPVRASSTVTVDGPSGFGGAGPAKSEPEDARVLIAPLYGPTPPGRYTVHWRVVSGDKHVTQGDFRFEVMP